MTINDLKKTNPLDLNSGGEFHSLNIMNPDASHEDYKNFFSKVKKLTFLTVNENIHFELPEGILDHIEGLTRLTIQGNSLQKLPESWLKKGLHDLRVNCPNLRSLPKSMGQIEHLNSIILESEYLTDLSPLIARDIRINELHLTVNRLEKLPSSLSKLRLQRLHVRGNNLKKIGRDLLNNKELSSLLLQGAFDELPEDVSNLESLQNLQLFTNTEHNWTIPKYFPSSLNDLTIRSEKGFWYGQPNFKDLKSLNRINFKNWGESEISEDIQYCSSLGTLINHNCRFRTFPDSILKCLNIYDLNVRDSALTKIEPVHQLPKMHYFNVSNCPLESIPQDWNEAKSLGIITITSCGLLIENLSFAATIPNLKAVSISGNKVNSFGIFLMKKALNFTGYEASFWKTKGLIYKNFKEFVKIGSALARTSLPKEDQLYFLDFFRLRTDLNAVDELTFTRLLQATNINHNALKKKVQTRIDGMVDADATEHLDENSLVYISGKTKLKKTELTKMLVELNIPHTNKYSDKVTHVILGINCKDHEVLKYREFKLMTEPVFQQYYTKEKPKFLQEAAQKDTDNPLMKNVSSLLRSQDPANKMIGLSMLEAGGVPPDVIEDLIVIQKTTEDTKVRKQVTKLVQLNAPEEWQPVVRDKLTFRGVVNNSSESQTYNQLKKLAARTSTHLAGRLSCLLYIHHQKGLRYALRTKLTNEIKHEAMKLLFDGTHFDYSRGIGYRNWKGKKPEQVIMYSPGGIKIPLPKEALKLGKIESLNLHNCKYETVQQGITKFKDLKILDLSNNYIENIPPYFQQLNLLEELDLSFNRFTTFPVVLLKLPNLKRVDMRYNSSKMEKPFSKEEREKMMAALPDCTVVFE